MKKTDGLIIGGIFVLLAILGVIHHIWITGRPFDIGDMLHHEFFEAIFLTAGIVLILATRSCNK
jgi:hypothetical protein